jgi:UDP-3-O-acyl-N-acetylglucosamine deacetylase
MFEKTIKDIVKISGKTLHKGNNSTILLKPFFE